MSGRPILQETASVALTNIATDLKEAEGRLPSELYLNTMDRVMVAKNELKRKRDEKYVKVTYKYACAVASAGCCGEVEAQLVASPSTTSIFRLMSPEEWHASPDGFIQGAVMQRMLGDGVAYSGHDARFFILGYEHVEM